MNDDAPKPEPSWREHFPISWDRDAYVTRRELAKFLTLGSALLAAASAAIAIVGARVQKVTRGPVRRVEAAEALAPGGSALFRYPSDDDPCIALRGRDGTLRAFSQVCTHLSCAVVHRPEADELYCPCHAGHFSAVDGRPTGGPPTRRLPLIHLEERDGQVFAVAREL
jgi:Rieske Fe-S protein